MEESFHGQWVNFTDELSRKIFLTTYLEVLWDSMISGIVTPNKIRSGEAFPGLLITEFGWEVLNNEHAVPYDRDEFLDDIREHQKHCVNEVTIAYLRESIGCFNRGLYDASVLLLGVAAESLFLNLSEVVASGVPTRKEGDSIRNARKIGVRMRLVNSMVDKYQSWKNSRGLESVDMSLKAVFHMIRKERNELGHPVAIPKTSKRKAFAYLVSFAEVVGDMEALAEFIITEGLSERKKG